MCSWADDERNQMSLDIAKKADENLARRYKGEVKFEEDEDYIRVTLLIKKSTYDGLKNLEGIYCVSLENMLELEADKLLDEIDVKGK